MIVRDVVIVGSAFREGGAVKTHDNRNLDAEVSRCFDNAARDHVATHDPAEDID